MFLKKWVLFFCISVMSFAADATVEIVKKIDVLPKIAIQDASPNSVDLEFRKSMFKLIAGDLRVSSHFRVEDEYLQSSYDGGPLENFLSDKKVDLILQLNRELSNAKADFNDYAKHILKISKLPQKLNGVEKLDFDEFLTELKKQKVNTNDINIFKSLKAMFEEIKAKKSTIETTDKELDRMVLKLYGVDASDLS